MRTSGPVTQREYLVPAGQRLVSTTDLKSRITYCNPSFIEVSGYTREELLGQPHNMIRHPDMPPEAFRDMWATIRSGQPWSAMVKNRRKNGDHYWVVANVTPLVDKGETVGYMSVRVPPTREQVAAAEALYATMREELARGSVTTTLQRGQLKRATPLGRLRGLLRWGMTAKIVLSSVMLAGVSAGLGFGLAGVAGIWLPVVASVLLGGLAAWWLHVGTVQPLQQAVMVSNRMAAGDLQERSSVEGDDDLARIQRGLGQLNVNLQAIVGDVRTQVDGINDAAREIASGSRDLSQRTEAQAGNLQQTASALEQITGTIQSNAESARQANELAERATKAAESGGEAVAAVVTRMGEIRNASDRIGDIIQVIDAISFQTNMLALNAAVESARAGDAGRGFAVVASEVRALAARTSAAAREVKTLIQDSAKQVDGGSELVAATGRTVQETLESIRLLRSLVAEISHASGEQASGIGQVNQAVAQLDGLTQQNAAMVEELSASAGALNQQAAVVSEAIRVLRT